MNESLGAPTAGPFDDFADVEAVTVGGGFLAGAALGGAAAGDVAASVAASFSPEGAVGGLRACQYGERKLRNEIDNTDK